MITGQVPSVAASLKKEGGWLRMIGQMKSLLVVVQIREVHTIIDTGTATTNRSHKVLLVGFFPIIPDTDIGHQGDGKSDCVFHHAFDDIPRHRNIGFGHFKNQFVVNL